MSAWYVWLIVHMYKWINIYETDRADVLIIFFFFFVRALTNLTGRSLIWFKKLLVATDLQRQQLLEILVSVLNVL